MHKEIKSFVKKTFQERSEGVVPKDFPVKDPRGVIGIDKGRFSTAELAEKYFSTKFKQQFGRVKLELDLPLELSKKINEDNFFMEFYDYINSTYNITDPVVIQMLTEIFPLFFELQDYVLEKNFNSLLDYELRKILPPMVKEDFYFKYAESLGLKPPSPEFWKMKTTATTNLTTKAKTKFKLGEVEHEIRNLGSLQTAFDTTNIDQAAFVNELINLFK